MYELSGSEEVLLLAGPAQRGLLESHLRHRLEAEDVTLHLFHDLDTLRAHVALHPSSVALLHAGPDASLSLLRELRAGSNVPVIVVLPEEADESDRLLGFDAGADDVVVEPLSTLELAARLRALRRRARPPAPGVRITFGPLEVDLTAREVHVNGRSVPLTAQEFNLLAFLAANPRQTFSRRELLDGAWRVTAEWNDRATVTEHVRRLRRKLQPEAAGPDSWITTVHGIGYRFDPPERVRAGA